MVRISSKDGTCSVPNCGRPTKARGWCGMHYKRAYTHGNPETVLPQGRQVGVRATVNCTVGGCSSVPTPESGKYCDEHHREFLQTGKHPRVLWKPDDVSRFWSYVAKGDEDSCWLWEGPVRRNKRSRLYGQFGYESKAISAHRYSYELSTGQILDSRVPVHHTCSETLCVNPRHLQATTPEENTAEMLERRWYQARIAELEAQLAGCACQVNT